MKHSVAVFLICITFLPVSSASMINAGFETGDFSDWITFGQGWRIGVGGDAQSGDFGAVNDVLTNDVDTFRGVYQNVPVAAGATYSASVYVRAVNVESSESWLELQWLDESGGVIGTIFNGTPVSADQPFLPLSISTVIAPFGAVTASVRGIVFMPTPPTVDADFHIFDTFSMAEHPASLLSNRGFETDDFTGWTTFGQGWRISSGGDADGPGRGAVNDVLASDSDEWRGVFQNIPVEAGAHYAAWVNIRSVSVETSSSWLEIQWLDEDGQILFQEMSAVVSNDQPFTSMVLPELIAPAGAVTASVRGIVFMAEAPSEGADFHIFDGFTFIPRVDLNIQPSAQGGLVVRWDAMGSRDQFAVADDLPGQTWVTPAVAPTLESGDWVIHHTPAATSESYRLQLDLPAPLSP